MSTVTSTRTTHPVGLNWTPQSFQSTLDSKHVISLADRVTDCIDRVKTIDRHKGEELKTTVDKLTEEKITVAFGGRFKSGKSLLVNRLLGRDILPVNIEAETGAPCFIEAATEDRAIAFRDGETIDIPCTKIALQEQLSLWRQRIGLSTKDLVTKIEIGLSGSPIPKASVWVDTPGIDDSLEMDAASCRVFRDTDVLVWILNSDTPLSIHEQNYLAAHTEDAGPLGIVFFTNVFIRDSTQYDESWKHFLDHQLTVQCNRLKESAVAMGFKDTPPRMLALCAAAMGRNPMIDYGANAAQDFIYSLASPEHLLVRASRLHRLSRLLKVIATELKQRRQQLIQTSDTAVAARENWYHLAKKNRALFEGRVAVAADDLASTLRTAVIQAGQTVASEVDASDIKRDDTYGKHLRSKLYSAQLRVAEDFAKAVKTAAIKYRHVGTTTAFQNEVYRKLSTPPINVTVPEAEVDYNSAVALGTTVGLVAGFFTLGLGFAAGATTAAALSKQAKDNAVAKDADGARTNIIDEAISAAAFSARWKSEALDLALSSFEADGKPPLLPNRSPEEYLEALATTLIDLAAEADHLAIIS